MQKQRTHKLIILTAAVGLTLLALAPAGIAAAASRARAGGTQSQVPAAYPSWAGRFYSVAPHLQTTCGRLA
jgi:hypothetical protein